MTRIVVWTLLLWSCCVLAEPRPNVLFIAIDDLRPELGAFYEPGSSLYPNIYTPNLDALAADSLLLRRAFVQVPKCNPSRTALLTGRRPETTRIYNNYIYFRDHGNFTTLPQYFKENGYYTVGMGKIFHSVLITDHDAPSWSNPEEYYTSPNRNYWQSFNMSWVAVPPEDREQRPLPDAQIADHAVEVLRQLAENASSGEQPFFMAVGLEKPHLPLTFPEEFLDLYPMEDMYLAENPHAPVDMPDIAWKGYNELRWYDNVADLDLPTDVNTSLPDDLSFEMRRAYYSTVSYIDALVGRILTEVQALGLYDNTIISFFGDHGYHLGEHAEWCKQTAFDLANHVPLMVRIPGMTDGGIESWKLAEVVDLNPTLVEAAGLPVPPMCPEDSSSISLCREATSMIPLIQDPEEVDWKESVFSQIYRNDDDDDTGGDFVMGFSIRTDRYRYTEWPVFDLEANTPDWDDLHGVELYDHEGPHKENVNLAYDPAYEEVRQRLRDDLRTGWRSQVKTV